MAIYVYRREPSQGARELAEAIGGRRARGRIPIEGRVRPGDYVICWGEALPPINGVHIINGARIQNKFQDVQTLRAAGVPTIEAALQPPRTAPVAAVAATDPAVAIFQEVSEMAMDFGELEAPSRERPFRDGLGQLLAGLQRLQGALNAPIPTARPAQEGGVADGWLPRMFNHVGGNDLLRPPANPDFWVKKLNFTNEYRIHSFNGKSLRAGIKAFRDGYTIEPAEGDEGLLEAHPWIRSYDAGWRIKYDGISSKKKHRELAHAAVKALGLEFGAVDIGEKRDGTLVVLEVNRAPGIEGGTVEAYAKALRGLMGQGQV